MILILLIVLVLEEPNVTDVDSYVEIHVVLPDEISLERTPLSCIDSESNTADTPFYRQSDSKSYTKGIYVIAVQRAVGLIPIGTGPVLILLR